MNYRQFILMGSVGKVLVRPGCLPSRWACQPDRDTRASDASQRPLAVKRRRTSTVNEALSEQSKQRSPSPALDVLQPLSPLSLSPQVPGTYLLNSDIAYAMRTMCVRTGISIFVE